jgi:hypothetical protein
MYVEDEFEKVQNSMENMAVATDANTKKQVEELSIQVGEDINAAITTEQTVRAAEDEALADQINTVIADFQDADSALEAAITAEQVARADGDSALADQITVVAATAGSAVFRQDTEPTGTVDRPLKDGDLWYDTGADNHPYIYDAATSSWVDNTDGRIPTNSALIVSEQTARIDADSALAADITALTATVNGNTAAITSEQTARIDADSAIASDVSTLSTTVSGHTATITSIQSSVNGLQAKAGVQLDVNGYVTGWVLNNNGSSGEFIVSADRFAVVNPSNADSVAPFEVVGGQVKINGTELKADSVSPTALNVATLSAITATIGTLRTATTGARVEIKDNLIECYDASNVKRVRLGVW